MDRLDALVILNDVKFGDYRFHLGPVGSQEFPRYLQATYHDTCVVRGIPDIQHTRKWPVSPEMTESELVQTAFKCALTSYEHRAREAFTYQGARVFGPHFDINDLVRLCKDGRSDAGGRDHAAHDHLTTTIAAA